MTNERFKTSTCTCDTCVEMCSNRPCWPTPAESKAIQDAGYSSRLMRDYWVSDSHFDHDVDMLVPAIVGYEGGTAPTWPTGQCTFLKDGKCELHDKGLKPLEGRVMDHLSTYEDSQMVRLFIVNEWDKSNQSIS